MCACEHFCEYRYVPWQCGKASGLRDCPMETQVLGDLTLSQSCRLKPRKAPVCNCDDDTCSTCPQRDGDLSDAERDL